MVLPPRFRKMGRPRDSWLTPCIDSATLRRTLGIASRMPTSQSDRLTMNRHSFEDLDEIVHCLLLCSPRDGAPPEGGRLRDCWQEDSRLGGRGKVGERVEGY